jgi:hypothetical protein
MTWKLLSIPAASVLLSGCEALKSPGGRVTLLVLVPAALIFGALWLLRRRDAGKTQGRGPRYPDYDDRD